MKKNTKTPKKRLGKQVDGLFRQAGAVNKNGDRFDQERQAAKMFAKQLEFAATYGSGGAADSLRKLIYGSEIENRKRREALASQLLLTMAARADLDPTCLPEVIKACILSSHEFYDQFDESMK